MVDTGYQGGVPTVDPRGDAGAPYQRTTPTALAALGDLGTTISKVGDQFSNIVVDDQFNELQKRGTSLLYGESKPDGTSTPGYTALNGKAALDARPGAEAQFDGWVKEISKNMLGPQQEAFSQRAGAYRNSVFGTIGSHANAQSVSWATNVNAATRDNALTAISNAPDDLKTLQASGGDLVLSYQKDAELAGASPGDAVWREADAQGRREALKARVAAIGAKDPSRAMTILDKNRNIAGADYDALYQGLKSRADQQDGFGAADAALSDAVDQHASANAISYTNPALPIYQQTAANIPGGMSAAGLARTVQIESGGDPTIANASDHVGLGQFSADTAKSVGITDRTNPNQSIAGIQRYAAQNAQILSRVLGRPPTDAELYLAHQQGAGGASKLLANPTAPAASIVGSAAVIQNGGTQGMSSAEYIAMWAHKFGGTAPQGLPAAAVNGDQQADAIAAAALQPAAEVPAQPPAADLPPAQPGGDQTTTAPPVAPSGTQPPQLGMASIKANAMQAILDNDKLSPEARAIAITRVNQQYAAMAVADAQNTAARKQASDAVKDQYVTRMLNGDVNNLADQIANDPTLQADDKLVLNNALLAHADQNTNAATAAYGSGFYTAYNQVLADPGDPSRISDATAILRRAAPGGDLTLAGAQKLIGVLTAASKNPDAASIETGKASLMAYAKSKLSTQRDPNPMILGDKGEPDPVGERLFQARFVPKFLAAFDAWKAAGKDPWEFLTQDNVDKLADGIRNPQEMAMHKLTAGSTVTVPPPPGIDQEGWNFVVQRTPGALSNGNAVTPAGYGARISMLAANPTPQAMSYFDAAFADGLKAKDVLDVLGIEPLKAEGNAGDATVRQPGEGTPDRPGRHAVINGVEDFGLPMPVQ